MEEKYEKISNFLSACEELIAGPFALAERKISGVLKALAESKELRELFSAVTSSFDYAAAKRFCLRAPEGGRGKAYLPAERTEVLAFVFCLLVELDAGSLRLDDFLTRYFYVDGSYTASYCVFSERMLRPFCEIVRECFPDCGRRDERKEQLKSDRIGTLTEAISAERARLPGCGIPEEDVKAGDEMLAAASAAAAHKAYRELAAIMTGYGYYLRTLGIGCERAYALIHLAEEL